MESLRNTTKDLNLANSPEAQGVVPGSRRHAESVKSLGTGRLAPGITSVFQLSSAGTNRSIVGSSAYVFLRGKARLNDQTDVLQDSGVQLSPEASNQLFESLTLTVNGVQVSHLQAARLSRHVVDHFCSSARNGSRQVTADSAVDTDGSSDPLRKDIIVGGKSIMLTRPLDDLPLFGVTDGLIPSFATVELTVRLTDIPEALFSCVNSVTATPYIEAIEVGVAYDTVELQKEVVDDFNEAAISEKGLQIPVSVWETRQLSPSISLGAASWTQSNQIVYSTPPNALYLLQIPQESDYPAVDAYKGTGRLHHVWNRLKSALINSSGAPVAQFTRLEGPSGKSVLLQALSHAVDPAAGLHGTSLSDASRVYVDEWEFMRDDSSLALVPFANRSFGETERTIQTPWPVQFSLQLGDGAGGATYDSNVYVISVSRKNLILSLDGNTRLV